MIIKTYHPDIMISFIAENSENARENLLHCIPDILLVDVNLPGESGLEFSKKYVARDMKDRLSSTQHMRNLNMRKVPCKSRLLTIFSSPAILNEFPMCSRPVSINSTLMNQPDNNNPESVSFPIPIFLNTLPKVILIFYLSLNPSTGHAMDRFKL